MVLRTFLRIPTVCRRAFSLHDKTKNVFLVRCSDRAPLPHRAGMSSHTYDVQPFAVYQLKVRLPLSVHVSPLDPLEHPNADRFVVDVDPDEGVEVVVKNDEKTVEVVRSAEVGGKSTCHIMSPINYDVDVQVSGAAEARVQNMECPTCVVKTEEGDCHLKSIKGMSSQIDTGGGSVYGEGTILGNVDVSTHLEGSVKLGKLQGQTMSVATQDGTIDIKDIYAELSTITSDSGNINVGSIHGTGAVETTEGNITIDTVDGDLSVTTQSGNVSLYVSRHQLVDVTSEEGDICISVPHELATRLELTGKQLEVDSELRLENIQDSWDEELECKTLKGLLNSGNSAELRAVAKAGKVSIKAQSWLDSLKLRNKLAIS
ncbi:protein FAM185A-like [Branchiostoma floridae]|uniref:Protein FAM185A-like n=1 Tax=Branchiostoma floridae TaxID=7739 RepID=A0A9J7L5D0_BRAFL|nr:protein FAM185A-like [Branchiostoma floridae]